jgi:hypothetical protein
LKREARGERGARGNQGECAMYIVICIRVYKECVRWLNDTSCVRR